MIFFYSKTKKKDRDKFRERWRQQNPKNNNKMDLMVTCKQRQCQKEKWI